jgi:mono/diheme cytochrome c family protein
MRASRERVVTGCLLSLAIGLSWLGGVEVRGQGAGHGGHGTPAGWKLSWPAGEPARGRAAFVRFECASCHEVRGESFAARRDPDKVGPELSAMGPLHEPDYFVEAIVNPSAVIEPGKGYEAPDGSSKMPSYNDSLTVQELVDLVAYLRSLRPPGAPAGAGAGPTDEHGAHH